MGLVYPQIYNFDSIFWFLSRPPDGSYANLTNFNLNVGSAGGGNVTVTITDRHIRDAIVIYRNGSELNLQYMSSNDLTHHIYKN